MTFYPYINIDLEESDFTIISTLTHPDQELCLSECAYNRNCDAIKLHYSGPIYLSCDLLHFDQSGADLTENGSDVILVKGKGPFIIYDRGGPEQNILLENFSGPTQYMDRNFHSPLYVAR